MPCAYAVAAAMIASTHAALVHTPPLYVTSASSSPAPQLRSAFRRAPSAPRMVLTPLKLQQHPVIRYLRNETMLTTKPCAVDPEGCLVLCDPEDICSFVMPRGLAQRLKVGSYFALWFALSVGYSITNKKVTNALPAPWSVATATVVVGSVFVQALWMTGLRKPPKLSPAALRTLLPIGIFHVRALTHARTHARMPASPHVTSPFHRSLVATTCTSPPTAFPLCSRLAA